MPKAGLTNMLLKIPPSKGAEEVANVDEQHGKQDIERVGALDRVPEFFAAEGAQIQQVAGTVEEVPQQREAQTYENPFPRLYRHERADYWSPLLASSGHNQCSSNAL